jgi:hypothetical protein
MGKIKFYQGLNPKVVWDPSNDRPFLTFSKEGEFETDDENLIKLLKSKGYLQNKDLAVLARGGVLSHGGFEKLGINTDDQLPSGRLPIENQNDVHTPAPTRRPVKNTAAQKKAKAIEQELIAIEEDGEDVGAEVVKKRTRKDREKPVTGQKKTRAITRRSKK